MGAVLIQDGRRIDYTPTVAKSAGDVVIEDGLVGIASVDIPANRQGALDTQGVFGFDKQAGAGVTFARGQLAYWDAVNKRATPNPSDGKCLGVVVKAAGNTATKVWIKLQQTSLRNLLYAAIAASAAVSATTAETNFDKTATILANTLQPGTVIRVRAQVIATATNGTDTLTLKLKIGSTVIIATAAVDVANNDVGFIEADIVIRTIGAGGTMVATGNQALGVEGTVTAKPAKLASTAIDTTVDQTVAVSATWSTNNGGNSCRLDVLNVEILR